jgi:hypothetical protein
MSTPGSRATSVRRTSRSGVRIPPYVGSVHELDDRQRLITFRDEQLLPRDDRGRRRLLFVVSNAHPESIRNGMFHTAETGIAELWLDLRDLRLLSGDVTTLASPTLLRELYLTVGTGGRPVSVGRCVDPLVRTDLCPRASGHYCLGEVPIAGLEQWSARASARRRGDLAPVEWSGQGRDRQRIAALGGLRRIARILERR